jgi:hypothetical protein
VLCAIGQPGSGNNDDNGYNNGNGFGDGDGSGGGGEGSSAGAAHIKRAAAACALRHLKVSTILSRIAHPKTSDELQLLSVHDQSEHHIYAHVTSRLDSRTRDTVAHAVATNTPVKAAVLLPLLRAVIANVVQSDLEARVEKHFRRPLPLLSFDDNNGVATAEERVGVVAAEALHSSRMAVSPAVFVLEGFPSSHEQLLAWRRQVRLLVLTLCSSHCVLLFVACCRLFLTLFRPFSCVLS